HQRVHFGSVKDHRVVERYVDGDHVLRRLVELQRAVDGVGDAQIAQHLFIGGDEVGADKDVGEKLGRNSFEVGDELRQRHKAVAEYIPLFDAQRPAVLFAELVVVRAPDAKDVVF